MEPVKEALLHTELIQLLEGDMLMKFCGKNLEGLWVIRIGEETEIVHDPKARTSGVTFSFVSGEML